MSTVLKHIPLKDIRESPVALRSVNRTSEQYLELVDSIRKDGVLNAILVREVIDPETKETVFGLVDGLHRFTASQDAGRDSIPAQVRDMNEGDILEAQVLANVHKIETRPVEYSTQLTRILAQKPTMSLSELAQQLSKSPTWLSERLHLVKLNKDIAELVDDNKINLSNAYALAKLPPEEQPAYLERAQTMSPQEFVPTAAQRVKELKDAKRQGRQPASTEFVPVAHVRKIGEIKDELNSKAVARALVHELQINDPVAAFSKGIEWVLHMDEASIAVAKQKDLDRKKEDEAKKVKRDAERNAKKLADAQAKAEELKTALSK